MSESHAASEAARAMMRVSCSTPWWEPTEKQRHRGKIFRSGNSLAFRIPAGTRLSAGMEMDLTIEDGQFLALEPVGAPKRKFNVAKVAGSAQTLRPIEDRTLEERALVWPNERER